MNRNRAGLFSELNFERNARGGVELNGSVS